MKIEDIFNGAEGGTLTLEQFSAAATKGGAKFVDLSEGGYVSQSKHTSELSAKDKQIDTLNDTIAERDKDLAGLKQQLTDAGNDAEKLSTLSTEFSTLQEKYENDTKAYQSQLASQAREFAIKEYAATKKFTSAAARRDYIKSMQDAEEVKLSKKGILTGTEQFDTDYSTENADAFVTESAGSESENTSGQEQNDNQQGGNPLPMFAGQTNGEQFKDDNAKGTFGFSFIPQSNSNE